MSSFDHACYLILLMTQSGVSHSQNLVGRNPLEEEDNKSHQKMLYPNHSSGGFHMGYEGEDDLHCPEYGRGKNPLNKHCNWNAVKQGENKRKHNINTFGKLSLLPNGEFKGELLLVYVRGLLASDGIPSLFDSGFHFRWWLREINAFNPLNQTSASSLSLQI